MKQIQIDPMEKETKTQKPHVLVLPYPAQGHINPMLQFSKRLVSKGLKATLATTTYIAKSMPPPPPASPHIDVHTISDGFADSASAAAVSVHDYLASLHLAGPPSLAALITNLAELGRPVTAVIYDGFMPWAFDVAKAFGLTTVLFFTQTCAVNNIYYHVAKGLLRLPLEEETVKLPGLPVLGIMELPSFVKEPHSYPDFYDLIVNGQFCNVEDVDWVLFTTFYHLEAEVLDWVGKLWRIKTIGPTIPSMYLDNRLHSDTDYGINLFTPMTHSCHKWLDTKPPASVVYVSFGSMASLSKHQTSELATAMKESNYSFLWVVREAEKPKLPDRFAEETEGKVLVVTWAPQLEVLSHESVGCFVTHCGLNSVMEAVSVGVAVVGVPQWSDQRTNGKYVEEVWGTGVRVGVGEDGVARGIEVERCIKEVMEGERGKEVKRNVIKWRELAKEAVDEGGSSDKNIDEFVASLIRM